MKEILNKRLKILSAYILDNDNIIDIGCDHGLLGIYLYLNRKNINIISSDINEKPLKKAYDNLVKYHLEDKITLVKADGLNAIDKNIDTIVISGMGAINIVNILKDINNYPNIKKIILSPNNDFPYLREELYKLGFSINKEEMAYENNKYYLVSMFIRGTDNYSYIFGKLDLNKQVNKEYFIMLYNKNMDIINKVKDANRKDELIKLNKIIKEKLNIK